MTDEPNAARCEPPPELRSVDGWHWVQDMSGPDPDTYRPVCWQWVGENNPGKTLVWWADGSIFKPYAAADAGYRYLAPVTPPAEVERLRAEVERLRAAIAYWVKAADYMRAQQQLEMSDRSASGGEAEYLIAATALRDAPGGAP